MKDVIRKLKNKISSRKNIDEQKILMGKILSSQYKGKSNVDSLDQVEFSIFSQFGDDGIIQYLIHNIHIDNKTFIEFGVGDYYESNTRFLMMNNNWSGLVMDGSEKNIYLLKTSYYYWKHDLNSKAVFIDENNINTLISEQGYEGDIGLLHIDLDGNDYYILKAIEVVSPVILILEYNSVFGKKRPISVPYNPMFIRGNAHYSNLFWGASLKSLCDLATIKGYSFIGCNSAGNNAYFVRDDKLTKNIQPVSIEKGFVDSKYRESRDKSGKLSFLNKDKQKKILRGLDVFNTETKKIEKF